jgi:superfamily I DNA/RNA helicase
MEIVVNQKTGDKGVPLHLQKFVIKAYRFARQWGIGVLPEFPFNSREKWMELVDHFDLMEELIEDEENPPEPEVLDDLVRQAINWTCYVIRLGASKEICAKWMDFEDFIYLPLYLKLRIQQFDNVLVDECQDLNITRILLSEKMVKPGGRIIFVGDPHQAIFGFTGADSESMNKIKDRFKTTVLPLTYSFRCPQSVVQFVRQWVSHIEAHPDAPIGFAPPMDGATITHTEMMNKGLTPEDAILCRNNAPLVELFFAFLAKGIACHIEGKDDVGAAIVRLVNKFPKVRKLDALRDKLEAYKEKEVAKLLKKGKEDKVDRLTDIVDAIFALMGALPATANVADLKQKVDDMFADTPEGKKPANLTLTTSHKAKGREWKRVFWYGRNRWNPSKYARQPWQMEQEINLMYVAGTRAKSELYDVTVPAPTYNNRRAA